jgi:hypothetical protein
MEAKQSQFSCCTLITITLVDSFPRSLSFISHLDHTLTYDLSYIALFYIMFFCVIPPRQADYLLCLSDVYTATLQHIPHDFSIFLLISQGLACKAYRFTASSMEYP